MPTTSGGIRYPASTDSVNVPRDLQYLAEDVQTYLSANAVTTTGTQTLTNKTIGSTGLDFEGATNDAFETTLTVVDPTADRVITLPNATGTVALLDVAQVLTNKTIDSSVNTLTGVATITTSQTLTNKTLTTPIINTATENFPKMTTPTEVWKIVGSAATGTIPFYLNEGSIWNYTTNASANHTPNFRWDSTTTLDSILAVGQSVTAVWIIPNGTTAYYPNTIQVDGTTVTPKIQGGTAITAGNASAIDVYSFTIIKTASATFTVYESQNKFSA